MRIFYINSINREFNSNYNKLKIDYNTKIMNYHTYSEFHNILFNIHERINIDDKQNTPHNLIYKIG